MPLSSTLQSHPEVPFTLDTRMYQDFLAHLCRFNHAASPLAGMGGRGMMTDAQGTASQVTWKAWGPSVLMPSPTQLTLPIREANLSLRTFISSFSWFFCC